MYEFDDRWGHHRHTLLLGPPYEAKTALTCPACVVHFNYNRDLWRADMTVKHNLPDDFWNYS